MVGTLRFAHPTIPVSTRQVVRRALPDLAPGIEPQICALRSFLPSSVPLASA
jgi:hypothetical protein